MSECDFGIGNTVAYPGGSGEVIAVEESDERKIIKVKTQEEGLRIFPTNLPWLK